MAERRKVGIIYQYNEGWIGGAYYVQNLIASLNFLEDEKKPSLFAICANEESFVALKQITCYPYLYYLPSLYHYPFLQRGINKLWRLLFKQNMFDEKRAKVEVLFPVNGKNTLGYTGTPLYWIPDFQDHYFPHFFPATELQAIREWRQELSKEKGAVLVLSSQSALDDYNRFYPCSVTTNVVIPFAVNNQIQQGINSSELLNKYGLPEIIILSPNQFWMHKNHQVILDALLLLKKQEFTCKIVFTGKEFDHRNPDYVAGLKEFVEKNKLDDMVKFLGFIDRQDQLQLMQLSKAVLQPSKFEGWSTVVEDAKALNKPILASAIPVHREQLGEKGYFFEPDNAAALAALLKKAVETELPEPDYHYAVARKQFAEDFYHLVTEHA